MGYWIVTGASRGLGYALASELLSQNHRVYGLGRGKCPQFPSTNGYFQWFEIDLTQWNKIESVLQDVFQVLPKSSWTGLKEELVLVNNAGMIAPVKPAHLVAPAEWAESLSVNLLSPMILASGFARLSRPLGFLRSVINISSGAGRRPVQGWSAYCAAKAGLDRFTQTMALDEEFTGSGLKVYSLAPGLVDTGMQEEIRGALPENFSEWQKFQDYKSHGKLVDPVDCARSILKAFHSDRLKAGELQDLREL